MRALIGPTPVEDSVTLPLTVLNLDRAGHKAEPDLARHRGDLGGVRRTDDDGARLGRRAAPAGAVVDLDLPRPRPQIHLGRLATRILPLAEMTLTEPSDPCSSTAPELVPTMTSVPVGHRTWIPREDGPA